LQDEKVSNLTISGFNMC